MEVMQTSPLKQQLDILWRPHPLLPAADCQRHTQEWQPGQTVREVLLANGVDPHQPIVIVLDDRLLTVAEWDTVCPQPGQLINVKAEVEGGGGGGGSNPLQVVAMIALVVVAVAFVQPELLALAPELGLTGLGATAFAAAGTAVFMAAGSLILNSVFAAQAPSMDTGSTGQYSAASPTYSLAGGQNRSRPYESMPIIMGKHRHVPDSGAKPFTEYHGEDQYLYQIFHLGLSTADRSDWKVGTNSISNYKDWSWRYPNSQGKIPDFPGNVDSTSGAVLENAAGWIVRTTSSNTYRIGVDIEGTLYYANNGGGLDATSVQLRVQYRESGSGNWREPSYVSISGSGFVSGHYENYSVWVESGDWGWTTGWTSDGDGGSYYGEYYGWVDTSHWETRTRFVNGTGGVVIISGASQAPRRATLFIDVPTGTYDVRVIRDTGDSTDARLQNKTSWSTLRSYQLDTASYVGQIRQGITIRASEQLNGAISQMSYLADAYAYHWNGSAWTWGKTSNPAHWFADFAKGRRDANGRLLYGIGLADNQIDLASLDAWATFCANENLTFNAVVDRNQTAADLLSAIARAGFASPTWGSGKLGAVWDARNASPVMAFGMSNIIRGSFEVNYITEQLAEEIIVRYVNPNKDWTQDEVRVTVPGVTTPTRTSTIDLYGCTSQTMAGKFANYMAAQQYYRKRRIKWESDFEGFVCQRGDVVLLSHDLTQWGYSGRVVNITGNTVTLDRTVPRSGGTEYLMLKKPDGTMTTYTVNAGSGESDTVTLASTPSLQSDTLPMDHIWFFSPLATPGKKVKILSVAPVSDSRVQVIATDEDAQFYSAWDGSWSSPPQSTLLLDSIPTVDGIRVSETLHRKSTGIFSKVSVTFNTRGSFDHASYRWRINSGPWTSDTTFGGGFSFDTTDIGTLTIEITPIGLTRAGKPVTQTATVYGVSLPPSNVSQFTIANGSVAWAPVDDVDVIGYEIRWNSTGSTDWASAQAIHGGLLTASPWKLPQTFSGGALLIKAVDVAGNRSLVPAWIILPTATIDAGNIYNTIDFGGIGWPGAISGGTMTPGGLIANISDPTFWMGDTDQFWDGDTDQFWDDGYSAISYTCQYSPTDIGRAITLTLNADTVGTTSIQYRRFGSTNAWLAWPGSIIAETGGYEFRVTVAGGKTQGRINSFQVYSSTQPTVLYINDQVIASTGTRLPIGTGWHGILGVKLTVQSDGNGAKSAVTIDKSVNGPLINCFNAAGTQVQGLVDAEVRLY